MSDLLSDLNPEQQQAVKHKDGPCLVVAGAGTGKTTVITRRIAWLISQKIAKPEEIVALTFTDKAGREMEERVDQLVAYGQTGSTISTFHSFAANILRDHSYLIGLPSNFSLYTKPEEMILARKLLFDFPLKILKPGSDPSQFLRDFIGFISRLKDENVYPEEFTTFVETQHVASLPEETEEQTAIWQELAECYKIYQNRLNEEGALGFADLIPTALRLINEHSLVRNELTAKIKFLLIDEYQDTNWAQAELAGRLIEKHQNIFVVGDDDQAIYAFRGAAVGNILGFHQRYPKAKLIVLTKNYRSSQTILDAAYRLIQENNPDRLEFSEKINKRLTSDKIGLEIEQKLFSSQTAESRFIADRIQELTQDEKQNFDDIAILVRSRAHAQSIRTALKAKCIPHFLVGDQRFYELPIIKLVLSYLKALANPTDSANLFYLLTSEIVGVGEGELKNLISTCHYYNQHLIDLIRGSSNGNQNELLNKFFAIFDTHLILAKDEPASAVLLRVFHDSGLYEKLINQENKEGVDQLDQLSRLYEVVTGFEEKHLNAKTDDFIAYLNALIESGEDIASPEIEISENNRVKIITVHQSKGLEFPTVFLPSLVRHRFPSINRRDKFELPEDLIKEQKFLGNKLIQEKDKLHLEEERRLFYVAATRARERLILTSAQKYGEGGKLYKISPFIIEALGEKIQEQPIQSDQAAILQLEIPFTEQPQLPTPNSQLPTISLSPSKLESYQTCPWRYRYQYFLKIRVLPGWQLNFGTSVHNILRAYYNHLKSEERRKKKEESSKSPRANSQLLEAILSQNWVSGGFESKKHENQKKAQALEAIEKFIKTNRGQKIPIAMEQKIAFKLPNGDLISGRIDRIDQNDVGELIITDYKTSTNIERYEIAKNIQLATYILALKAQGKKVVEAGFILPLIEAEQFAKTDLIDLDLLKKEIEEITEKIKKSEATDKFEAKPSKINCHWCDYKHICPFRWQS